MRIICKNVIIIFLFIFIGYLIFNNSLIVKNSILYAFDLWLKKVFPSLFPMFIISDILINCGVSNFLGRMFASISNKLFKVSGLSSYVIFMALISGTPSNAIFVKDLYEKKYLTVYESNKILAFSFFLNPLFLYSFLSLMFEQIIVFKIIGTFYLGNFIIGFLMRNIYPEETSNTNWLNTQHNQDFSEILTKAIKKAMNNMIMILGTISFFIILSSLLSNSLNLNVLSSSLIKGFLEVTSGLNELVLIRLDDKFKAILSGILVSFGGVSIHMQIKSIINDTLISYNLFFIARIIHALITTLILILII